MKRRIIFWILIIAFIWLVVTQFSEIKHLAQTIARGSLLFVGAAVLLQVAHYLSFAGEFQFAFKTVEVKTHVTEIIPLVFGSIFINVVAPTGGTAGAVLFVDYAARNGQSPARAAAGALLQVVSDFIAVNIILIFGLVYLFIQSKLQLYEIIAAIILFGLTFGLSSILLLGLWSPTLLRRILERLSRVVNHLWGFFSKSVILAENWAEKNANEFNEASQAIAAHPIALLQTFIASLFTHSFNIASLYLVFLAFGETIAFGPLTAGYAMGILFWIVSITPQGIGVVEGVMAIVYSSLGIPGSVATVVVLVFRGLAFWLPLLIGFILLRRVGIFSTKERIISEAWSPRILAILTALMGGINVIAAVTPNLPIRIIQINEFLPLVVRRGGHLAAAIAGFALLLLSRNIWRRKRTAWLITMIILVISAISYIIKGLDVEEAVLAIALAAWLWFLREHFTARSDPPSVQQGVRVLIAAILFILAYGVTGFYFLDHHYSVNFNFSSALRQTVIMFTQFYNPNLVPITGFGRYFANSIYIIAAITLTYAFMLLVRPVIAQTPAPKEERLKAKKIIERSGHSSLAGLALLEDKSYFFGSGGSVIAYTVIGRTIIALGDPIGPIEDAYVSVREFREFGRRNDWLVTFYQVLPDYIEIYTKTGFDQLKIGQEAVVNLLEFTLEGHNNKPIRNSVTHLVKEGYKAKMYYPPIPDTLILELQSVSDEWLADKQTSEGRFSLGWFDDDYIRNSRIMTVQAKDGEVKAFANLISEYRKNEVAIDLMRHRKEVPNGIMDFLFVSLFIWAKENGYESFDLGLSALSGIGTKTQDPAVEQLLHFIYDHVNQFYNFKGLHEYKEKFHPVWSPRYLVYPGLSNLATVWLAIIRANSGEGNLPDDIRTFIRKFGLKKETQ